MNQQNSAVQLQQKSPRSIEAILERRERRMRQHREILAPDFLHGSVRLDDIYNHVDESWVEKTVFVVPVLDKDGHPLITTIGYFQDYFFQVEHFIHNEGNDFNGWLEERIGCRVIRVNLLVVSHEIASTKGGNNRPEQSNIIDIRCTYTGLMAQEREHLNVTRDHALVMNHLSDLEQEDLLICNTTNLLTFVCLFGHFMSA